MNLQRFLLGVFVIAVLSAAVFWFLQNYKLTEVDEQIGFRGEAKTNSLFAARLFIKRMGIPAERRDTLQRLPNTDTVLILDTERYTLSPEKIRAILAWVEKGGHLITQARLPPSSLLSWLHDKADEEDAKPPKPDLLQQALGINVGEHVIPDDDDLPLQARLPDMPRALKVDPDFFYDLKTSKDDAIKLGYKDKTWLLQQAYGLGMVTLASSLGFLENPALAEHEHAEFLWRLLHSHAAPTAVWLVHQDDMPPLLALLWRHAWPLLLTLSLFIPLLILARAPRFGPLIPQPAPERRRILEHIEASGQFMWKRARKDATQYPDFTRLIPSLSATTRNQHDTKQPDARPGQRTG